ncbi:MAG: anaerobic ribonucleoside-triphosphate reductase activating protein [Spirochaetales bacterium]|nr:anaerobic ribonucleoside-triphosphate reductase activating protein [Spirochaetales bacterium]
MTFSGFEKTDLINYPGLVASTVFTCGCNFRCPYCHNPEFVIQGSDETYFGETYTEEEILSYLTKRRSLLDGLVISGGEPTLHKDLAPFMRRVKDMGFKIKLDTNGSRPEVLKDLISQNLVDFVAMDIKAPLEKYHLLGFTDTKAISMSIDILEGLVDLVDHEFRTTCPKSILDVSDFAKMADLIGQKAKWYLQPFNPKKTLDPSYNEESSYSSEELEEIIRTLGRKNTFVR